MNQNNKSVFPSAKEKMKEESIEDQIDEIFNKNPSEVKKVAENLTFIENIQENNIPKGERTVDVWGVETFDLHDIFKDMIWDRSIFTTDAIVNMCVETSIERMKKYLPKKTRMSFQYWWIFLLIILGVVGVLIFLILILPNLLSAF